MDYIYIWTLINTNINMKAILLRFLALTLVFTAFVACSDDDDNPPPIVINDIMVAYNTDTGEFSAIDLSDGSLLLLGTATYNGSDLLGLRDMVYNPANGMLYASSRATSSYHEGALFRIDPMTMQATVINDNANDDWYAVPNMEMYEGKLLGTVYWDEYNYDNYTSLVRLNLDGSIDEVIYLSYQDADYNFSDGMGLEYGDNPNEFLITDGSYIARLNINGTVIDEFDLIGVGFPGNNVGRGGGNFVGDIRSLERDADGNLYGLDRYGVLGLINVENETFTYITEFDVGGDIVALMKLPETIFQ